MVVVLLIITDLVFMDVILTKFNLLNINQKLEFSFANYNDNILDNCLSRKLGENSSINQSIGKSKKKFHL